MKGRKDILQKVFAGCLAVMLGGGGMNVSTLAMEKKETVLQEKTDQTSLETREMEELTETEKYLQTYEPEYVTVRDTSTYTTADGSVKMLYVSMNDITLAKGIPVIGDCGEVNEPEINGSSEDFFNDCSENYCFMELEKRIQAIDIENDYAVVEKMQTLYLEILNLLTSTYYEPKNIELSNFGDSSYYCMGKVDYSHLELTREQIYTTYMMVLNDHPIIYFTNNLLVYDDTNLYLILDEEFKSGEVRENYNAKIKNVMTEFKKSTEKAASNYEIAKIVHDTITENVDYAYMEDGITPKDNGKVHGMGGYVSNEKEVVCDGYAKTFSAVLNYLDIENVIVTGWGVQQGEITSDDKSHAWNMVRLGNGEFYHVDVTFDDMGELGNMDLYFCMGQEIFTDHSISQNGTSNYQNFWYDFPESAKDKFVGEDTLVKKDNPRYEVLNTIHYTFENGVLTFGGRGGIFQPDNESGKWHKYKNNTRKLIFEEGITYIGFNAFRGFEKVEEIVFPKEMNGFGCQAFRGLNALEEVTFPDEMIHYEGDAFSDCIKLKKITFGKLTKICPVKYGSRFFPGNVCLETITVPEENVVFKAEDNVLISKWDNFLLAYACQKKEKVYAIPEEISGIFDGAFDNCANLQKVIIPDSVEVVGTGAFTSCNNLKELVFPPSIKSFYLRLENMNAPNVYDCYNLETIENKSEVPMALETGSQCIGLIGTEKEELNSRYWRDENSGLIVDSVAKGKVRAEFKGVTLWLNRIIVIDGVTYCMITEQLVPIFIPLEKINMNESIGKVKIVEISKEKEKDFVPPQRIEYLGWMYDVAGDDEPFPPETLEYLRGLYEMAELTPKPSTTMSPSVKPIEPSVEPTVTNKPSITVKPPTVTEVSDKITPAPSVTVATAPSTHKITYNLKGGTNHKNNPATYKTKDVVLKAPQKKGYTFEGWYLDKNYKKKITKITAKEQKDITVYAKWKKVSKPSKPVIKSLENIKGSKLKLVLKKKTTDVRGFEVLYSTDKAMKKSVKKASFTSTSKIVSKLKKGKTYYVKARAYKLDSAGEKVYGSYSNVKKVQIKK